MDNLFVEWCQNAGYTPQQVLSAATNQPRPPNRVESLAYLDRTPPLPLAARAMLTAPSRPSPATQDARLDRIERATGQLMDLLERTLSRTASPPASPPARLRRTTCPRCAELGPGRLCYACDGVAKQRKYRTAR
jgi:hypothetical protein